MNTVQPIRDIAMIAALKDVLMKQHYRNYFLFVLGINTGLRISDLLTLKVGDVREKVAHYYHRTENREVKTVQDQQRAPAKYQRVYHQ